jgi:hypothetical protein
MAKSYLQPQHCFVANSTYVKGVIVPLDLWMIERQKVFFRYSIAQLLAKVLDEFRHHSLNERCTFGGLIVWRNQHRVNN